MPWLQTGITHYRVQLGLSNKYRVIKGLVVCYVVWLGLIYVMGLWTIAKCVSLVHRCGKDSYQAQVPQYPIDTCS